MWSGGGREKFHGSAADRTRMMAHHKHLIDGRDARLEQ
jgi:hypothetical protein